MQAHHECSGQIAHAVRQWTRALAVSCECLLVEELVQKGARSRVVPPGDKRAAMQMTSVTLSGVASGQRRLTMNWVFHLYSPCSDIVIGSCEEHRPDPAHGSRASASSGLDKPSTHQVRYGQPASFASCQDHCSNTSARRHRRADARREIPRSLV